MMLTRKADVLGEQSVLVPLRPTQIQRTGPVLNQALRGERSTTNRLSYQTAQNILTWFGDAPVGLTFNNCTLCPHCIYVFCIYLSSNSDLCYLHHKLIGFYNRDEKCLLRGTDWVFKQSSLRFVFKGLTFRHRASCILGQTFHYSPENAFYIFNQQIYFVI